MTASSMDFQAADTLPEPRQALGWTTLSFWAQVYVLGVITAGISAVLAWFPTSISEPWLFVLLMVASCLTSLWKINLPIPLASGSTLSVSYAADLTALLLLGPQQALMISLAGVWAQCAFHVRQRYPWYRTAFSVGAEAVAMAATGIVYQVLGGPLRPVELSPLAGPLVGAIATYFLVNTGLVAGAIGLTSERRVHQVWLEDFSWSGASFMVAGSAGALAAVVIARGEHWLALLMLAPVYLTYKTYQVFIGRLEDRDRHAVEARRLHQETAAALSQAQLAERALAKEKNRLADSVAELTRLEVVRQELLESERAARESAEEGNRLKDQFLATVSHELRTPLNAILGWADMLRSPGMDEPIRDRACRSIYDNARQQARMIDELLDVARIVSGKLRLERAAVDLHQIVDAAVEVVATAAEARRVSIDVETDGVGQVVYGDGARLQQIIWNLLSNAVKFSDEGGRVLVQLRRLPAAAEIVVSDNGVGIPPEFLPCVFEPFRQADASTTRRHGGLGLGLSIVKHLAEAHGGTITVSSAGDGKGSTFTVKLPARAATTEPARWDIATSATEPLDALAGISVLVLDDNNEGREVVAAQLRRRRATVLTADSPSRAIEILRQDHIDVILADIAMPGEDGYAFIKRVRGLDTSLAKIPAAALTALATKEDQRRAIDCGFQMHLAKPIDGDTLISAVSGLARGDRN